MSIDVNVQNDLVIVTETTEDIVVNVSNAAGPQGPAGAAGVGVPVGGSTGQVLKKFSATNYDTYWAEDASGLTSVGLSVPTGLTVTNSPLTTNGTIAVGLASGYSIPTTASQATWDAAYNDSIVSAAVTGTTTKTLTLNQQDGGSVTASWSDLNTDAVTSVFGRTGAVIATEGDYTLNQLGDVTLTSPTNGQVLKYNGTTWVNNTDTDTGLTSVGLSMPSAFAVSNSPLTSNGTIAVTGAGLATQYIRGDGQLATFPSTASGGSSVNYYLNGSVNASVAGYKQLDNNAIVGGGTDFTLVGNGLIAQFLTDAGNPNRIQIPGGAWSFEMYFQVSSAGGNQKFYIELHKYDGSTFTLIASSSAVPEEITGGTSIDLYLTSLAVPTTTLLTTDRLAIRVYIVDNAVGRTITLHTENTTLCEIITTFSGGVSSLNGLSANTQYFATGTSGTDFGINSVSDTHTFNLPIASGTNTGKLSNTDWTTFNSKQNAITLTTTGSSGASTFISNTLNVPTYTLSGLGGVPTSRTLTINGTAFDLSADRSYSVGTVTSITLATGTTGTDVNVSNGTIISSGTITLNIPDASATARGLITTGTQTIAGAKTFSSSPTVPSLYLSDMTAGSGALYYNVAANRLTLANYNVGGILVFETNGGAINMTLDASANLSVVGTVTAASLIKSGGTSSQFLKADGSVDSTTYQPLLTNPVTGTGTTNYLPKWTSGSALGNSNLINDASGNLGLGVTPSAWGASTIGLDIGAWSAFAAVGGSSFMGFNSYSTSTSAFAYKNTGAIALGYQQTTAGHNWYTAPSGTAGNAISFTQAMTLTSGGNLLLGTTTDSGEKLQVNGSVLATNAILLGGNSDVLNFKFTSGYGNTSLATIFDSSVDSGNHLIFKINTAAGTANERMRIAGNGSVMIATSTNTGESLIVGGTLRVTGAATYTSNLTASSFIKSGGTSSQYLMADGSVTTGGALTITNRQTASYTLALTDADKLVEMNVATANNLTVPLNSSVAFAIGTKIDLSQYGAGQTTVVATGGVTLRSAGGALKLAVQYSGASLVKIATNEWYLFGDITV